MPTICKVLFRVSTQPLSPANLTLLSAISLFAGIAGVLTLHVLFPDASVAFGFVAIASGLLVLIRGGSGRSRVAALVGVGLGVALIAIAVVAVVTG
jgi:hypothetical protein